MSRANQGLFAAVAIHTLCMLAPPAHAAASAGTVTRVTATGRQLLAFADRLARGAPAKAETILAALSNDPNPDIRNEARFRRSKLLQARGQSTKAALLLREILDESPKALPVRIALAQLLERMGDHDGAWRQIRAAQAAGLPPAVARMVDRYSEALRAARPFGASLEIALAPDSNINGATRSDTLGTVLGDFRIDRDGKAKSGTGLSLHGQAYRRFGLADERIAVLVRSSGVADLYRAKEFNNLAVDFAAGPELQLGSDRLNVEMGVTQRWFGQKPFLRSARLGASFSHRLGRRAQLRVEGSAALVDNQLNDLQDGKTFSGALQAERALSATTGIAASIRVDRQSLRDPGYSTLGWRSGLLGWHDLGRVTLTAGAEIGRLYGDERLMLFPDKRLDRYSRVTLGATFRRPQFRGLAPVIRLSLERNRSTIEFYDFERTRTEVGLVRAF